MNATKRYDTHVYLSFSSSQSLDRLGGLIERQKKMEPPLETERSQKRKQRKKKENAQFSQKHVRKWEIVHDITQGGMRKAEVKQ